MNVMKMKVICNQARMPTFPVLACGVGSASSFGSGTAKRF